MIVLQHELLTENSKSLLSNKSLDVTIKRVDDGDVYIVSGVGQNSGLEVVNGVITISQKNNELEDLARSFLSKFSIVIVLTGKIQKEEDLINLRSDKLFGFVRSDSESVKTLEIQLTPVRSQLYSRTSGMYETDVLANSKVLIVGLGSGGSAIAIELAKAGVGNFILIDHDRLEIVNVVRHICGVSDIGRYKTKAVKDMILEKNPYAQVETRQNEVDWDYLEQFKEVARKVDIIFCGTDNRPSRVITNLVSLSENKTTIYAGTFRRAYGGQILRVYPNKSLCYQCFIDTFPMMDQDREISSENQAKRIAYSDRPVPVEPGLASDIAPISNMCVKLGILELLRGYETSLKSLYVDLANPLYHWINRREIGSDYEDIEPLDSEGGDFRILAWYSVAAEKNPRCPACGNYKNINP